MNKERKMLIGFINQHIDEMDAWESKLSLSKLSGKEVRETQQRLINISELLNEDAYHPLGIMHYIAVDIMMMAFDSLAQLVRAQLSVNELRMEFMN